MHKKRNWIRALRRSKSFRYFVISYVALLCAIMALNMVYYRKSSSMLFEQSVAMNNTQAERFASTLETEISNCMDSLLKIEKTYAFSQLLNDDSAGNALDRWDIYELRAQMKMALRGSMEDMFLYFSGQDIVVSAPDNSTCSSKIYYRTYYGDARQSYEAWAALLQPSVSVRCAAIYADGLPCLAISRALPTADRKNLHATVVCVFEPTLLSDFMDGAQGESAVAVYGSDGALLLASDDAMAPARLPEIASSGRYARIELAGQALYIAVEDSRIAGCRYVSLLSEEAFLRQMRSIRVFQVWFTVGTFAFGAAIAFLMAMRAIRPLRETVRAVAESTDLEWNALAEDEFDYLKNTVADMASERRQLQRAFDRRANAAQQNFLFEALHGRTPKGANLAEELGKYHIPCLSDCFAVALIRTGEEEDPQALAARCRASALKQGCIANVLLMTSPELTCVFNVPTQADAAIASRICENFARADRVIAVSGVFSGGSALARAYRQVVEVREYRFVYGAGGVLTPEICATGESFHFNPTFYALAEAALAEDIRAGEYAREDALKRFDALRRAYSDDGVTTPHSARCFAYDLHAVLVNVILEENAQDFAALRQDGNGLFRRFTDLVQLRQEFADCLMAVNAFCHRNAPADELCARVQAYLEENYADPNLGVATLDHVFGLSSDYLSAQFKRRTGYSIGDALARIRVAHICDRLVNTEDTLEEIAASVGLLNSSTLIRIFKKYRGITPGAYRKRNQR